MTRPLMVMGIVLIAGMAAGWSDHPLLILGISVSVIFLYCKYKADGSKRYILGLSALFIVGFCRVISVKWEETPLEPAVVGRILRIDEKEKCRYIFLKRKDCRTVLVVEMFSEETPERLYKGQILEVEGEAEAFEPAANPGQFDEKQFYQSQGTVYKMIAKRIEQKSEGPIFYRFLRWTENLRREMSSFFDRSMGEEEAAVLKAAVVGERSDFRGNLKQYYQKNGWLHLVTVSGLHLSFIAMGLYKWLRKGSMPLIPALMIGITGMGCYAYMTDMGDSVLRAMGMMLFSFGGFYLGRKPDRMTALTTTAAVMLMIRPGRLLSVGFQLSFGAVLGVEYGRWLFSKWFPDGKVKGSRWVQTLFVQIGIFLTGLPILLWNMYEISIFGFFYNFFMIPLMSFVVPSAFLAGVAGTRGLTVLNWGAEIFMGGIGWLFHGLHHLPAYTWVCGRPAGWEVWLYVFVFMLGFLLLHKEKKWIYTVALTGTCVLMLAYRHRTDQIICMDVGQGDGICILTEEGHFMVIDGGSTSEKEIWKYRLQPLMKFYGIREVDRWFLTHGDKDHVSGIQEVLAEGKMPVGRLVLADNHRDEVIESIHADAEKAGMEVEIMHVGDRIRAGDIQMTCLYPSSECCCSDKNNNSLVLMLERPVGDDRFKMLLTGDLEKEGENLLIEGEADLQCDVLKVGHHGSSGASSEEFLKKTGGTWAVISCGIENKYGHPHRETLERLEKAGYHWTATMNRGAVFVEFTRKSYQLKSYKRRIENHRWREYN